MATTYARLPTGSSRHRTPERPAAVPIHRPSRLAFRLSTVLVVVAAITAGIGVFYPNIFRETAWTTGNARGTDLVILTVALPTLVVSMLLAARGSFRAQLVWLGGLSYVFYNSLFYAYGIHFNSLFLCYTTTLSLTIWSIVTLLRSVDLNALRAHFAPRTPVRAVAIYMAVMQALFALLWLRDIVPGMVGNVAPEGLKGTGMVTNAVQVTDFALFFPLTALAVLWLWRRQAWGYLLAGAFMVYSVIEAISVATDQTLGHIHDAAHSMAAVPIFVALALIALVPTIIFLRALREEPRSVR